MARLHVWQIQAVRDVLLVLAIIGLVWLGYAIRAVTVPLLVALLLAYLFEPLVSYLTNRLKTSRPVVVGGLLITVGAGVLILLAILVPLVIGQTVRFVQDVRAGRFQHTILRMKEFVPADYQADFERAIHWMMPGADGGAIDDVNARTSQTPRIEDSQSQTSTHVLSPPPSPADSSVDLSEEQRLRLLIREEIAAQDRPPTAVPATGTIWDIVRTSGRTIFGVIGGIVELGLLAFLIPFYFYFFSVSFPAVVNYGRQLVPLVNRPRAFEMIGKMDRAVAGFVRGRIVICFVMGVMLAIGWMIVGVPYSIVLGMVIGAFCLVPYLGGVGVPVAIGLLLFQQMQLPESERMGWFWIIAGPFIVFGIVQLVENYLLTPMIAGKATNLDPVTILVAVLAGGSIGGVYGMLLAIPVAACLKIIWTDVVLPKIRAWTRGEAADPLPISTK
jgi:predicted PurR-regulated permease PerM